MNSSKAASESTESATTGQKKKRRYPSAEKKFQIYLETQRPDQPVGEILRREGLFSTDLARIHMSYQLTLEKGVYLYLHLLLDEFSRKALHWRVGWTQTATEARLLLEGGLERENTLDLPENQRPELLNDRGRQMKAKPIRQLSEDYHITP